MTAVSPRYACPKSEDKMSLAVEQSATKLPWMNRKLDRRTHVRTN